MMQAAQAGAGGAPAVDELGLAEALQAEHLVVGLERGVADLRVGSRLEGADDRARFVDRLVLVQLVQVHLQPREGAEGEPIGEEAGRDSLSAGCMIIVLPNPPPWNGHQEH